MDKISTLIGSYSFNARVFFNGDFWDSDKFEQDGLTGHLHLVRRGPVIFTHEHAAPIRIDAPSLVFYPRGMGHVLRVADGGPASLLSASISLQDGANNLLARMLPECLVLPLAEAASVSGTLELLFAEGARAAQGRDVILDRLCDVLMVQVIRHQFETGKLSFGLLAGLADPHLSLVLKAISERPEEPWQLQTLAQIACMSRARFTEHFRKVVGMPPGEYLARWRIGLGQSLLREGVPVKVVSGRTGYRSPSAFTRAFTDQVGASPRQWLRAAGVAQARAA